MLVSVIITTKNEAGNIGRLLKSLKNQSYKNIEIIVVDNNSIDNTKKIARKFTKLLFDKGPERSAQRNFGSEKSKGEYLLFLDADMVLSKKVIENCVNFTQNNDKVGGVIIPEKSEGVGFWAKVKAYERSFYIGDDRIEAARFYPKKVFNEVGGFDLKLTGPEDWDLSQRVSKKYEVGRIQSFIIHDEGKLSILDLMKKKFYYAKSAKAYLSKNKKNKFSIQTFPIIRPVFYKNPLKIFLHPILFCAMIIMLSLEILAGGFGFILSK